jgi:hypothetical protein
MNEKHAGGAHRLATEHWPLCLAASGKMDVLLAAMAGVLVAAVNVIGVFCFRLHPMPKHLAHRRPNVQFDTVEPLHEGKLDGLPHTAGLSVPQQGMMMLFGLVELMDEGKIHQTACMDICKRRFRNPGEGMGIESNPGPSYDHDNGIIDLELWLRKYAGEDVVAWVKENTHPLDIPFRLAEDHGVVLLNGAGFAAPNSSARVSFADLSDEAQSEIGRAVRSIARGYVQACQASKGERITA